VSHGKLTVKFFAKGRANNSLKLEILWYNKNIQVKFWEKQNGWDELPPK